MLEAVCHDQGQSGIGGSHQQAKECQSRGTAIRLICQVCGPDLQHLNDTEELNVSLMDAGYIYLHHAILPLILWVFLRRTLRV